MKPQQNHDERAQLPRLINRRRALGALGSGGLAAVLAACTKESAAPPGTASGTEPGATSTVASATTTPGATTPGATTAATDAATTLVETTAPPTAAETTVSVDPPLPEPTPAPAQEQLPANGPATVGGVELPAGHVQVTDEVRLLWVTDGPVDDPAGTWLALLDQVQNTGLWPLIIDDDPDGPDWIANALFSDNPGRLATIDALATLKGFAVQFGTDAPTALAPASTGDGAALPAAAATVAGTRIALVNAPTGAAALSYMGWLGPSVYWSTEDAVAVIQSWEERYGAHVAGVGVRSVSMIIVRPPAAADVDAVAGELKLVNPDVTNTELKPANVDLATLATAPVWTLTWP